MGWSRDVGGGRPSNGFLVRRKAPHSSRVRPNTWQSQRPLRWHFSCGPYGVFSCLILEILTCRIFRTTVRFSWRSTRLPTRTRSTSTCATNSYENMPRMESVKSRTYIKVPARRFLDDTPCQGCLSFSQEL